MVAARQGNEGVVRYLLDFGIDPSIPKDHRDSIISAAAESGDIRMVHLILYPEYKLDVSSPLFAYPILLAAQIRNLTTRMKIMNTLWTRKNVINKPRLWTDVLFKACRLNDPELAEFVLTDGAENIYDRASIPLSIKHPLLAPTWYRN